MPAARLMCCSVCLLASGVPPAHAAEDSATLVNYISRVVPVTARSIAQHRSSALRPLHGSQTLAAMPISPKTVAASPPWTLLATLPATTVLHGLSFVSSKVGYAAGEHGLVLKTIDGGKTWTSAMSIVNGFNYYWYGIQALSEQDLVVSGFYDASYEFATVRWSHDGGATWSDDIALGTAMAFRGHFFDGVHGLVLAAEAPNYIVPAYITDNGGAAVADWTAVVADPDEDWFGVQFSALANGHVRASGISYCASGNFGSTWSCQPSIDDVFDGATFFFDDNHGWVAGGSISPTVRGWLHRTDDGGTQWSGRVLSSPWPIREIDFATANIGWAAGGNIYSGVGGIYRSEDGGNTWSLDQDTGAEMDACTTVDYMTWCAGYDASFNGYVYAVDWDHIFVDGMEAND